MSYQMMIGLETHVELSTCSKIFCGCAALFGAPPNACCCPVCVGLPGALPSLNRTAVLHAIKAGLALHCEISRESYFDRKNYTYPDLPKAYQITQQRVPICKNGYLELDDKKRIPILQIHLEEDAGKLIHEGNKSFVDYNRAGIPLIEIVSAPVLASAAEAREYLEKLRSTIKYLEISDCRMEEGSLRCDVNLSVAPAASTQPGTRVEIKNMNSISYMEKAIAYEFSRQTALLESGGCVLSETLRFDEASGQTERMRGKEETRDYRYFPDPDLPPLVLSQEEIDAVRANLPELPAQKQARYCALGLLEEEARLLIKYPNVARYFEQAAQGLQTPRIIAGWILGAIFAKLATDAQKESFQTNITPDDLRQLAERIEQRSLSMPLARTLLSRMLETRESLAACLQAVDTAPLSAAQMEAFCRSVLLEFPAAAADYRAGKQKAIQVLLGGVMRKSGGRANPAAVKERLEELLLRSYESFRKT